MSKSLQNPALRDFWDTRARYRVLYGGRSSSKSWDAGIQAIKLSRLMKLKVLCARQFQSSIKESVYTLLKDTIYRMGVQSEFTIQQNTIIHNTTKSEFVFYGIALNIEEIKSLENISICWIEEAGLLSKEQWKIIMPTIRAEGSEIWLIFNSGHRSDFVWERFIDSPHENSIVRKINYDENPYLSETMKEVIEEAKQEDYDDFEHIYLGKVLEGDESALFTYDEIEKAMDNSLDRVKDIDMSGVFSYALDVARFGSDSSVLSKRRGYRIYFMESYKGYSTMETANKVNNIYHNEPEKKPVGIFVDVIGIGAGVYDRLDELGLRTIEANVSMKADDTDTYYNKRSEMYFNLRDWIRKGGILPKDADLKEELLAVRYRFNNTNGKILIQPKDEIKELIGRSPDKSDSIALHFFSQINPMIQDMAALQKKNFKRRSKR